LINIERWLAGQTLVTLNFFFFFICVWFFFLRPQTSISTSSFSYLESTQPWLGWTLRWLRPWVRDAFIFSLHFVFGCLDFAAVRVSLSSLGNFCQRFGHFLPLHCSVFLFLSRNYPLFGSLYSLLKPSPTLQSFLWPAAFSSFFMIFHWLTPSFNRGPEA
jgi:hypothetical protein